MEIIYDDRGNILEGVVIKYYSDDKKMSETPYKNGNINGDVIEYHYNGMVSSVTPYVDGVINGKVKTYYQNGMIMEMVLTLLITTLRVIPTHLACL